MDTIKIAGNAVTSAVSSVRNDVYTGVDLFGTTYHGILEVGFFLPTDRETHVSVDIGHQYLGGANPFYYVLYLDNNEAARREHPYGTYAPSVSLSWAGYVGAGSHNFRVDTILYNGVRIVNRAILVMARAR